MGHGRLAQACRWVTAPNRGGVGPFCRRLLAATKFGQMTKLVIFGRKWPTGAQKISFGNFAENPRSGFSRQSAKKVRRLFLTFLFRLFPSFSSWSEFFLFRSWDRPTAHLFRYGTFQVPYLKNFHISINLRPKWPKMTNFSWSFLAFSRAQSTEPGAAARSGARGDLPPGRAAWPCVYSAPPARKWYASRPCARI